MSYQFAIKTHVILSPSKDDVRDKYYGSWFNELTMTWLTMTYLSLLQTSINEKNENPINIFR